MITSRVHPGETNASWMMQGLLDTLLSPKDEEEQELVKLAVAIEFEIIIKSLIVLSDSDAHLWDGRLYIDPLWQQLSLVIKCIENQAVRCLSKPTRHAATIAAAVIATELLPGSFGQQNSGELSQNHRDEKVSSASEPAETCQDSAIINRWIDAI